MPLSATPPPGAPMLLQAIWPLVLEFGDSDDVARGDTLESAPTDRLQRLVRTVDRSVLAMINSYLDETANSEESVPYGDLAQAAIEAAQILTARGESTVAIPEQFATVRIVATQETARLGYAHRTGVSYGFTTPTVTGVDVIGGLDEDLAVNVHFDGPLADAWFAPHLVDPVRAAEPTPGSEAVAAKAESSAPVDFVIGDYTLRIETAPFGPTYPWDVAQRDAVIGEPGTGDFMRTARLIVRRSGAPRSLLSLTAHGRFGVGFGFGVCLVPETNRLFVGADTTVRCYRLDVDPIEVLWDEADTAECGFHGWQRHGDILFMNAELGFAAWHVDGTKLWSTFVEPPWEWTLDGDVVSLTVMDGSTTFPVTGPTPRGRFW